MRLGIDPGHGAEDPGAVANGLVEAYLNLTIASQLAHALPRECIEIELSRWNNEPLTFSDRVERLALCDWVLSVHHNASSNPQTSGVEVYVMPEASLVERIAARHIIQAMPAELRSRTSRIVEADPTEAEWLRRPHAVLSRHKQPKLLVEVCYLTSPHDAAVIGSSWGLLGAVAAIASGVACMLRHVEGDY